MRSIRVREGGSGRTTVQVMAQDEMIALPRAEYPRPQFRRGEWLCLNGPWAFAFDDADAGLRAGWQTPGGSFGGDEGPREIVVPFAYQARLSGIGDRSVHPVVWYRRTVVVP